MQCPAKAMPFQQIIIHALQCQHDIDVHLLFCVDLDLHMASYRGHVLLGFSSSILTDGYHFTYSAQQKPCACLLNKLSCMHCMPTWCRCPPPILFWHWPPFNLFPSSCMIFFVDSHWWVPLCVQRPTIYMPFRQMIMYILQCPHDIHVHTYFVLTSINSCFIHVQQHVPPQIAGAGHPCSDRSLFLECYWLPIRVFIRHLVNFKIVWW